MKGAVITIGSELLRGRTADTNFIHIARELTKTGLSVAEHATIDDSIEQIAGTFSRFAGRYDFVISTGGLGPTFDDLTRQGLAEALSLSMIEDAGLIRDIRDRLESRNLKWQDISARQALLPTGASAIQNDVGIAPGLCLEKDGTLFFCLPGVPQEFRAMFNGFVMNRLCETIQKPHYRCLKLIGLPEVQIARFIESLGKIHFELAINVDGAVITIHMLEKRSSTREEIDGFASQIEREFGEYVFSDSATGLADTVGRLLIEQGMTIGFVESCTGGMISKMITDSSGSSRYFQGSVVSYANSVKETVGVREDTLIKHGAVSREVALEMAIAGRKMLGTDIAVSVTGIAGPTGGTEEKPVGLVFIAISTPDGEEVMRKRFGGSRDFNRKAAVNYSLYLAWKYLTGKSEMQEDK